MRGRASRGRLGVIPRGGMRLTGRATKRKAASPETGGCARDSRLLLRDAVGPLASLVLRGLDREPMLPGNYRDEAAHCVRLPVGCGHDLGQRGSAGPAEEVEHDALL